MTNFADIKQEVVLFYQNLFGKEDSMVVEKSMEDIQKIIQRHLPVQLQNLLISSFTSEEIRATIFSLNSNKAPALMAIL